MESLNCYTCAIRSALEECGICIPEELLFCGNSFLDLMCDGQYDAVATDLVKTVYDACHKMGISIAGSGRFITQDILVDLLNS